MDERKEDITAKHVKEKLVTERQRGKCFKKSRWKREE